MCGACVCVCVCVCGCTCVIEKRAARKNFDMGCQCNNQELAQPKLLHRTTGLNVSSELH